MGHIQLSREKDLQAIPGTKNKAAGRKWRRGRVEGHEKFLAGEMFWESPVLMPHHV